MKRSIFAMLTVLACSASAVGVSASPALAATDPTGTFSYVSTPGEFIGKGMTESFTTPGILIGAASFGPSSVDINVETSDFTRSFSLHFGAPTTAALTTGTYTGAGRFDSDTAPAISVTGNSSSCNSEGSFTVHDLSVRVQVQGSSSAVRSTSSKGRTRQVSVGSADPVRLVGPRSRRSPTRALFSV
jgi:hypothetical protein